MLTTQFYTGLAGVFKNRSGIAANVYVAIGEGDPAWDTGWPQYNPQTARLVNELARVAMGENDIDYITAEGQVSTVPTARLRFNAEFAAGTGVGTIRECGVFAGDADANPDTGVLLSYFIHPRIEKADNMALQRRIVLNLTPGTTGPGQVITRYLGNSNSKEFHDLQNETDNCQIDEIHFDHKLYFSHPEQAESLGYDYCAYCFGKDKSKR